MSIHKLLGIVKLSCKLARGIITLRDVEYKKSAEYTALLAKSKMIGNDVNIPAHKLPPTKKELSNPTALESNRKHLATYFAVRGLENATAADMGGAFFMQELPISVKGDKKPDKTIVKNNGSAIVPPARQTTLVNA